MDNTAFSGCNRPRPLPCIGYYAKIHLMSSEEYQEHLKLVLGEGRTLVSTDERDFLWTSARWNILISESHQSVPVRQANVSL